MILLMGVRVMNKEEFLKKLRKKIEILEESEVEDIIDEYSGFIDEKVSQGSSEEEAVKSLGNINELAQELLSAYKIKSPNSKKTESVNQFIDEFLMIIEKFVGIFANKSFKEIIRFIIELMCIFIIIAICKIPFEILKEMGGDILFNLSRTLGGNEVYRVLGGIGNFFFELCYFVFAVVMFVKIFEKRFLKNEDWNFEKTKIEDTSKKEKESGSKDYFVSNKQENIVCERRGLGILDALTNICVVFIKVIAFCILLGVIFYIIGLTTAFGISLYLLARGVFYFGFYIVILALLVLGIVVFIFLFNFIFSRKGNLLRLLLVSLSCIVLLGVGTAMCTIEVAHTTILYDEINVENQKVDTYTYDMKDNLVLEGYYDEFVVDDSLENQIKMEFRYNGDCVQLSLNPSTYKDGQYEILHSYFSVHQIAYDGEIFERIVEDLKDKTIRANNYGITVKVYASSKVIEQLLANKKSYEMIEEYDDDDVLEDICSEIYNHDYDLPPYCLPYYSNDEV